jgi:hypothetical protein
MYEVQLELKEAAYQLQQCRYSGFALQTTMRVKLNRVLCRVVSCECSTSISITSGCALFTNFVTRTVENITVRASPN